MATPNNTIKTRIQLKSDTEANWNKAAPRTGSDGFVPLLGELIVYTADDTHPSSRVKIGDGVTNVVYLPFIDAGTIGGSELPSAELRFYPTRGAFPSPGEENKLYIALDTQRIWCFTNSGGYTLLSNFTYTEQKVTASHITNWQVGVTTRISENGGIISINNGTPPTLNYFNQQVVSGLTKGE